MSGAVEGDGGDRSDGDRARWRGRPALSVALRVAIVTGPLALSVVAGALVADLVPSPHDLVPALAWWVLVLAVPGLVFYAVERVARRALPLTGLLKLTLLFPDRAPSRMTVAWKAGSTRALQRQMTRGPDGQAGEATTSGAETVLALAGALNTHDRLTRGHSERVRAVTDLLAGELELNAGDRERLRWSALLHDIGKLSIDPAILNKPGRPTDEEWLALCNHPLEGARLAAPLAEWLGEWARSISEHHERYDGAGYPYGLAGEDISYGGRIVAVADSYETITAVRSYKKALSPEAARREIVACAGAQFDPVVVRALLEVSLGSLRVVGSPFAWIGELPFVRNLVGLGRAASVVARAGAVLAAVTGLAAASVPAQATASRQSASSLTVPVSSGSDQNGARSTSAVGRPGTGVGPAIGNVPTSVPASTQATPVGSSPTAGHGGSPTTSPSTSNGEPSTSIDRFSTSTSTTAATGAQPTTTAQPPPTTRPTSSTTAAATTTTTAAGTTTTATAAGATTTATAAGATTTTAAATTTTTSPPAVSSLRILNGVGVPGRADQGDRIIVTYSAPPNPASFCGSWTAASHPDLTGPGVTVTGSHPLFGSDTIASISVASCPGGFHFGTIDLGQRGYFNLLPSFPASSVHWDGVNSLTVTLGSPLLGNPTQSTPDVAIYTPDPSLGVAGTIPSRSEEHF